MMPGEDERDITDDIEPNTDWRTAEIPMDTGTMAEILRTTPKSCVLCGGRSFVYLKQHGEVFNRMGLTTDRDGDVRASMLVCRGCGRVDWFINKPEILLEDADFAATVIECKS